MPSKTLLVLCLAVALCKRDRDLRGFEEKTPGGATRVVIDDDNGGGPCTIDGRPAVGKTPMVVTPGTHVVECGDRYDVTVKPGDTYHFDYWGP